MKLNLLIIILFVTLGLVENEQKSDLHRIEAKLIQANYQNNNLMVEFEINNTIYQGSFYEELSHEDYLTLHHNTGCLIYITYEKTSYRHIVIYQWDLYHYMN